MQGSICSVTQAQVVSRAYSKKLGGVEDTPVVVERDFSLIDGYGVIVGHDGKIVTPRYRRFALDMP